ncbi:hypothetical protein [Rhodohalobacter mucosus]|uniref:Phosphate-selective porin O/P n=1 Tax=Rhodohalobacter mucosus TaxID=2079485 RepID=A0A316TKK3_9BACT|nr:hypothetical protein [Rhodohalobacter mucosus]PWN05073.1 hypothetical protein DDZ15_16070 [Rhodohalobacter mucosus]
MKTTLLSLSVLLMALFMFETTNAQQTRDLQYYRSPDKTGINVFETSKETDVEFDGLKVRIGGANTLQFQALQNDDDIPFQLEPNFNLATSNLDIDVQLERGLRMHLRTYLSSRHHPEAWVKGGYLQVDRLDFISEGFAENLMDKVTIKVGHMEINYGDAHFRRSDNGQAIYNPFVGNYLMDSFTTEAGGEVYYQSNGFLAMIGVTNGKLNQSTIAPDPALDIGTNPAFVGKLGYDSQINEDLRVRLTGSIYTNSQAERFYLYAGDRAGGRYYNVISGSDFNARVVPGFALSGRAPGGPIGGEMTAIMINPFVKFQGLEFFGIFENASGKRNSETDTRTFNQYAAEVLYRFGENENVYIGGRYNAVSGELPGGEEIDVTRFNIGGGWFLTNNVLTKVEYVTQNQDYSGATTDLGFSGLVIEAVVSF